MKQLKRYQKGDAGATMVIVMLGFFGYQGMGEGDGHHSSAPSASQKEKTSLALLKR